MPLAASERYPLERRQQLPHAVIQRGHSRQFLASEVLYESYPGTLKADPRLVELTLRHPFLDVPERPVTGHVPCLQSLDEITEREGRNISHPASGGHANSRKQVLIRVATGLDAGNLRTQRMEGRMAR